jgi:hypothetical protein
MRDIETRRFSEEGRHVGLDVYDLLIEGHFAHRGVLSVYRDVTPIVTVR